MVVVLYGIKASAPFRTDLMTLEILKVPSYEVRNINLLKGEHLKPPFLKLNPQHCIPFMIDGDLKLTESRAIATYLINKYGGGDHHLYPADPAVRAIIDQRLYFDMERFYGHFMTVCYPQFIPVYGIPPMPEKDIQGFEKKMLRMYEIFGWAEDFAKNSPTGYIANTPKLSVADLAFAATYSTIKAFDYFDLDKYPNLNKWLDRVEKEIPKYQEINLDGAKDFGTWFKQGRQDQ